MKKLFLIMAIAIGMVAMSSCTSCDQNGTTNLTEFVYDVTATAKGEGKFAWAALPHTGDITLKGELVINATNDTTAAKVFTTNAVNDAPTLSAGLVSTNPEEAAAAEEVATRLKTTHLSGDYQLDATGYAKFGPFYFVIDEHYPPVNVETAE